MTLIYDADAEADEEMLTLMSNKNRQTDLHSPRLDFVHSEICTAHSHSILARKRKPISTSMKSIRIRNKGGYPINTPTWTDFGRRKEEEIGGAVAQMKASRRSDGSGGVLERRLPFFVGSRNPARKVRPREKEGDGGGTSSLLPGHRRNTQGGGGGSEVMAVGFPPQQRRRWWSFLLRQRWKTEGGVGRSSHTSKRGRGWG
ncbi:hypothetical protein LXL04_018604 [Taraxacum kok-saghyz]